jgi:hypothetical protein
MQMTFEFPQNSLKCTPEDKLGCNFEALDRIRMQCRTYIERTLVKDRSTNPLFKLASNHGDLIQEAHNRLKGVVFQICASAYNPAHVTVLLGLEDVSDNDVFMLHPQESPALIVHEQGAVAKKPPQSMGFQLKKPSSNALFDPFTSTYNSPSKRASTMLSEDQLQTLGMSIQEALSYLRWNKCNADFHVHLGVYGFGAWKKNKPLYTTDELLELMDELDDEEKFTEKR